MLFKCSIAFDMGMKIGYRPLDLTWTWPDLTIDLSFWDYLECLHTKERLFHCLFYFSFSFFLFYVEIIFKDFLIRIGFPSFFFCALIFEYDYVRIHAEGKESKSEKKEINWARQQRVVPMLCRSPLFIFEFVRLPVQRIFLSLLSFLPSFLHFPLSRIPSFEPSWEILEFCKLWYK